MENDSLVTRAWFSYLLPQFSFLLQEKTLRLRELNQQNRQYDVMSIPTGFWQIPALQLQQLPQKQLLGRLVLQMPPAQKVGTGNWHRKNAGE